MRWIALCACAYLVFAIANFPADVAWRWLAADDLHVAGIQGTVWSGRAALASAGPLGFRDVRWQVRPWSLLLARPAGRVESGLGDGFLQTEVRFGGSDVVLTGLTATCSLSALASALPIAGIRGQVSLQLTELVLHDGWPASARGQMRLGQLTVPSLVGGDPIALGNFNVILSGTDGLQGAFQDQSGPLEVRGTAGLTAAGEYEISGVVRARPEADAALRRGIELLTSAPNADGMRAFSLTGTL